MGGPVPPDSRGSARATAGAAAAAPTLYTMTTPCCRARWVPSYPYCRAGGCLPLLQGASSTTTTVLLLLRTLATCEALCVCNGQRGASTVSASSLTRGLATCPAEVWRESNGQVWSVENTTGEADVSCYERVTDCSKAYSRIQVHLVRVLYVYNTRSYY